jgi:hypothetical protein
MVLGVAVSTLSFEFVLFGSRHPAYTLRCLIHLKLTECITSWTIQKCGKTISEMRELKFCWWWVMWFHVRPSTRCRHTAHYQLLPVHCCSHVQKPSYNAKVDTRLRHSSRSSCCPLNISNQVRSQARPHGTRDFCWTKWKWDRLPPPPRPDTTSAKIQ